MYLDTHVVVWLASGSSDKLSPKARRAIDGAEQLLVSPMVSLELAYLHEIRRINYPPADVLALVSQALGLQVTNFPVSTLIGIANGLSWTLDVFDRLIVSECIHAAAPLITRDRVIRRHFKRAIW